MCPVNFPSEPLVERQIPPDEWVPFFASFSSRHAGWLVSMDVLRGSTCHEIVHDAPLVGISLDRDRIAITAAVGGQSHVTHLLDHPDSVVLGLEPGGAEESVTIRTGPVATRVRFRSTFLPEMIDGIA